MAAVLLQEVINMSAALRKALVTAGAQESTSFLVVAIIDSLGENYGFASVVSCDDEGPATGENIYVLRQTCEILLNQKAGPGDRVVLSIRTNGDSKYSGQTPWVAVFFHQNDKRNEIADKTPKARAENFGGGIAQKITDEAAEIIQNAKDGGVSSEMLRADAEFSKAFTDLKTAMTEGSEPKAKSALGRMRTRAADLLRPAATVQALKERAGDLDGLLV